ncbi:MAG: glycosyltransferase family 1 protein [Cyanobacteria bacterium P01_F01_bin.150]
MCNILIPVLHRPSKPTGVCRHAANLAQCLSASDSIDSIVLIIGSWQRDYFRASFNLESPKIELVDIDIRNSSISRNKWFIFGLPKVAQKIQPDIIHMSFPFPFVRQWFNAPVLATIHDLYPYECPENFGYPQVLFNQFFLRQCVSASDGLICVSKCTLDALERYCSALSNNKPTKVIYNIVDFDGVELKKPEQLETSASYPFLLTVAQHRKNKNLDLLIQVHSDMLVSEKFEANTQLIIVGSSGPETEELHRLVRFLKLENNVQFLSGIDDGGLRWLYEHASLFVIPSSTEGFCLPLVEALSLSCPTVCSDIPIFREVGMSKCRYFSLDHDARANLMSAITSELLHPTSEQGEPDPRFSSKHVAQQLLSFYQV